MAVASDPSASPWISLSRDAWAPLRASTPMTLDERGVEDLRGLNDALSMEEVAEVYLPLSRLLNLHVAATQDLHRATDTFLGSGASKVPYVIGIAGSVAVGKSTTARLLQALLARWSDHPTVELVTTDGFLHPNAVLAERGLMERKGFPESYDTARLVRFLAAVKAGQPEVPAPVYSHLTYDVVPGASIVVDRPDILILEGLNVLQTGTAGPSTPQLFVSDFFDFGIFVDAETEHVRTWYVDRFLTLRSTAFQDPASFFHRYAALDDHRAAATARSIWHRINQRNLEQNILPTRSRADLVLRKGADHRVERVVLRKL